jgi:hypothetical protein
LRREWTISICAALAILALPVLGWASASAGSRRPVSRPQQMQRRSFAIFRTAPEGLPPSIVASLDAFEGHGFNPVLAQRAQPPRARRALWVVPGRGQILLAQRLDHGCAIVTATTWSVVQRGLTITVVPSGETVGSGGKVSPDDTRAVGLVPDDVTAVRLARHLVARVRNNVFSINVGATRINNPPALIESR